MIHMSEPAKRTSKNEKTLGRPRKYADSKERYRVYNDKRPHIRVSPDEKELIEHVRKNPEIMTKWLAEIKIGF